MLDWLTDTIKLFGLPFSAELDAAASRGLYSLYIVWLAFRGRGDPVH